MDNEPWKRSGDAPLRRIHINKNILTKMLLKFSRQNFPFKKHPLNLTGDEKQPANNTSLGFNTNNKI
ncbi:MAG: hypothetical protein IGQ45_12710 [Cyanobacterium sp. T60_A2020_053]|nr:hypothetical protein [Cyanobacterium sp. T60_A2020_053]